MSNRVTRVDAHTHVALERESYTGRSNPKEIATIKMEAEGGILDRCKQDKES